MIFNNKELSNNDLEILNIIYDIFIDEERYTEIDVFCDNGDILNIIIEIVNNNQDQPGRISNLLCTFENDNGFKIDNKYLSEKNKSLWKYLFQSKKTRSVLQSIGSTNSLKLIDEIAEYLLSKLPKIHEIFNDEKKKQNNPEEFDRDKFLMLFYNEISQCYLGYLNTGFAERALRVYYPGECHYELLSLYNKAIGLAHVEERKSREKALKYFDEIIKVFVDNKPNLDYKYKDCKIDISLWKMYIYYPSIFHKADILIKLQRGQECKKILENYIKILNTESIFEINETGFKISTDYKRIDALILLSHAMIEATEDQSQIENCLSEIKSYFDNSGKQRFLLNKYKFLQAKNLIEKVHNKLSKDTKEIKNNISDALTICERLFIDSGGKKESEEQIQAANYWLEAFEICLNQNLKIKIFEKKFDFLSSILDLILLKLDPDKVQNKENKEIGYERWIPIKEDTLKLVENVLEKIDVKNQKKIRTQELRFWKIMSHDKNRPSSYKKVKCYRRRLLLKEKIDDNNTGYDFPDDIKTIINFVETGINRDYFTQRLLLNTESFDEKLIYSSYWPQLKNLYAFTILRKWQSFTPSLGSHTKRSSGGGYFVYKVGKRGQIEEGIVIDPGYDFIRNFLEHNFSIRDISTIIFTHSHIDHSVDFRGLITLIHEMNRRGKKKDEWKHRKIRVIVTPSCFDLFYLTLKDSRDCIKDIVVIDPDNQNNGVNNSVKLEHFEISAIPAYHKEIREDSNCVGFIIKNKNNEKILGFTGDTVWTNDLAKTLCNCPVVCINMGALLDVRKEDNFKKTFKNNESVKRLIYKENHLYLPGTITLVDELRKSKTTLLGIIGELGEELKSGLRKDLFFTINEFIDEKNRVQGTGSPLRIAIEDIGLTVTWNQENIPNIRCARCRDVIDAKTIKIRAVEEEKQYEQLYYYCNDCLNKIESLENGMESHWQKCYLPKHQDH